MPTILTHTAVPLALGLGAGRATISRRLLLAGMATAILPDLDVVAFRVGIPYAAAMGHRGFSHSLLLAFGLAAIGAGAFHANDLLPGPLWFRTKNTGPETPPDPTERDALSRATSRKSSLHESQPRERGQRLWCGFVFTFLFLFVSAASHPLLDAFTNGGLGVALFWPWSSARIFAPIRMIEVSPIGISQILSHRGWVVLQSEVLWVWTPALLAAVGLRALRLMRNGVRKGTTTGQNR